MLLGFKGGVHPQEEKDATADKHTVQFPIPELLYIHLLQHTGKPAKPIVKVGDEVQAWQKIGEADGFISASVHSPVHGKVKSIESIPHSLGINSPAIIIEYQPNDREPARLEPIEDWQDKSPDILVKRVKEAGIVGLGGAAFPTYVKLSPPKDKKIDTVILNGAECEPYLTADHRLMLENPEEIIHGLRIITYILGAKRAYIGIEKNKPDAIEKMREVSGNEFEVVSLKVKYPQGAEKQLIKAITNREVPSGGLPFDVSCYVQNVGTAKAIYEAVVLGKPLIERIVTLSGYPLQDPQNILTPIGVPVSSLIESCDPLWENIGKVIIGGTMMGIAQYTLDIPVVKGMSGIVALTKKEAKQPRELSCIQCGRCVDVCPMGLIPTRIASYGEKEMPTEAKALGAMDCIECGSCAYICPANRKLVHYIKLAKAQIRKMGNE